MPAQAQKRSTLTPSPAGLVVPRVAPLDPAKPQTPFSSGKGFRIVGRANARSPRTYNACL